MDATLTTNNGVMEQLWRLDVSVEVRLSSAKSPVANKDAVIQCLAHCQQGGCLSLWITQLKTGLLHMLTSVCVL